MRCWPLSDRCKDCASLILAAARASCRAPWRSWAPRSLATIHSSPKPSRPPAAPAVFGSPGDGRRNSRTRSLSRSRAVCFSLHHVPGAKLEGALAEARRLLRPLGRLYVAEPLPQGPHQYIMELFHDETAVRKTAADALSRFARPRFAVDQISTYTDVRSYSDFGTFSERMIANMRFNGYTREAVLAPAVRRRFDETYGADGGRFDQPVRIDCSVLERPWCVWPEALSRRSPHVPRRFDDKLELRNFVPDRHGIAADTAGKAALR